LRGVDPMESAIGDNLKSDICFSLCTDFGKCAPCDGLGETSIHQLTKMGHET